MTAPAAPPPIEPGVPSPPSEYLTVTLTDGPGLLVTLTPPEDPDPMNNAYKPGAGVTFTATFADPETQLPVDPTVAPACTVSYPDASTATPPVVRVSQGVYEATAVIPSTMGPGLGAVRWTTVDAANPTNNTTTEARFQVVGLDF